MKNCEDRSKIRDRRGRKQMLFCCSGLFLRSYNMQVNFWLPKMLKDTFHYSDFDVSILSALPYCGAGMLLAGWSSDRRMRDAGTYSMPAGPKRRIIPGCVPSNNIYLTLAAFCLAGRIYSYMLHSGPYLHFPHRCGPSVYRTDKFRWKPRWICWALCWIH